ncbi:MAG TPA: nucleoside-diphosphate sugar epimerase/dehydratase [Terriglobales bacterium]|nr:nucleoside-diphosphate sugar epimerase/dehydratase [Terriglobales bacterium]
MTQRGRSPHQPIDGQFFLLLALQIALIAGSVCAAWLLRYDFRIPNSRLLWEVVPILVVVRLAVLPAFNLAHACWRYTGIHDAVDLSKAILTGSLLLLCVIRYGFGLTSVPVSIYMLEALISFMLLLGVRILWRLASQRTGVHTGAKRLLLVGAGHAAQMIIREAQSAQTEYTVIGCADDDPRKRGLRLVGVPVLGGIDAVPEIVARMSIDEILIAIPSATSAQMRRIMAICKDVPIPCRTVPCLAELVAGRVTLEQAREICVEDLLGRSPVELDMQPVHGHLRDRVVMVTGAAGSIGSELCRQISICGPKLLVCLDQDETGIFQLQHQLAGNTGQRAFCVADCCNQERMQRIFRTYDVEVVFHAAAYKHVPVMEANVEEAVSNNVFGLLNLLNVAQNSNCSAFVMISSDKAVHPTNVMGCTKRIGELMLAAWPEKKLRCVAVRFGNVLGSNGSVIPIFQEQIRHNQPITITHPDMTRFLMTISEAVSLVLQAFVIGRNGDILVLDMGEPIKIMEVAKALARLSGKPRQEFKFIGIRPGEKLFEELFYSDEQVFPSACQRILRTESGRLEWGALKNRLAELYYANSVGNRNAILAELKCTVPQFTYEVSGQDGSECTAEPVLPAGSPLVPPRELIPVSLLSAGDRIVLPALSGARDVITQVADRPG